MTRDERILAGLPVARRVAAGLRLRGADGEDAEGVAVLALVELAAEFDPARSPEGSAGWHPWAAQRIRFRLADWGRAQLHGQRRRRPPVELLGAAARDVPDRREPPARPDVPPRKLFEAVTRGAGLTPQQEAVLWSRCRGLTIEAAGAEAGVVQSRASVVAAAAAAKVRAAMAARGLTPGDFL